MKEKKVTRSINYPRPLYLQLRAMGEEEGLTNREQVREAVTRHLARVEKLLIDAGFAKAEGDRQLVRAYIDKELDARIEGVAEALGVDFSAVLIACLRRHYKLRLSDDAGKELRAGQETDDE